MARPKKSKKQDDPAPMQPPVFNPGGPASPGGPFQLPGAPGAQTPGTKLDGVIDASQFTESEFLRGVDLPSNQPSIDVRVLAILRQAGPQKSPLLLEIDPVKLPGMSLPRRYLPLNKMNIKIIVQFVGNNLAALIGKTMTWTTYPVNNPQTGQMTRGLYVTRVA